MDVNKKGAPLQQQEINRWQNLWKHEAEEHARLKEQYEILQWNFEKLYKDGFEKYMRGQLLK